MCVDNATSIAGVGTRVTSLELFSVRDALIEEGPCCVGRQVLEGYRIRQQATAPPSKFMYRY